MWLLEAHYEQQEEELELLNHTIKTAIASINSKKNLKLFNKNKKATTNSEAKNKKEPKRFNTKEEKLKELEELKKLF